MKRNNLWSPKILLLGAIVVLTLSACGKTLEDPEAVISKAKQAIVEITSGNVEIITSMTGGNGVDDLNFSGDVKFAFDKSDRDNQMIDLSVDVSGNIQTAENTLNGDLDLDFVTTDKEYYVRLNEFQSSDESLTAIQPFINLYMGKWLRIAEDFIPQNIRDLQGQDEVVELKKKQLEDLFVDTQLFTVTKEYGVEKLNGNKVYHYGLEVDLEGFKEYISKAAIIDGRELTTQKVDEAVNILTFVKEIEIYIDTGTYYVLKAVFRFSGDSLAESSSNLTGEIVVEGSDFNESLKIKAPEDAEDFNPLNLLMGLGGAPVPTADDTSLEVPAELGDETVEEMVVHEGGDEDVTEE